MLKEKIDALKKVFGGDEALVNSVIQMADTHQKAADEAGIRTKAVAPKDCLDGFHWDEAKQDCVKDAPKEGEAPSAVADKKEYVGDMEPAALKALINDAVTGHILGLKAELQTQLDTATTTKEAEAKAYADSLKSLDAKLDGIAKSAKSALDGVAELKGELPRRLGERLKGYHPSTDGDEPDDTFKDKQPVSDTVVDKFMASLGVAPQ